MPSDSDWSSRTGSPLTRQLRHRGSELASGDTLIVIPTLRYRVLEVRDSPDDEEPGVMVVERA
jgi:hypothetical protein